MKQKNTEPAEGLVQDSSSLHYRYKKNYRKLEHRNQYAWEKQFDNIGSFVGENLMLDENKGVLFDCYPFISDMSRNKILKKIALEYPDLVPDLALHEDVTKIRLITRKDEKNKIISRRVTRKLPYSRVSGLRKEGKQTIEIKSLAQEYLTSYSRAKETMEKMLNTLEKNPKHIPQRITSLVDYFLSTYPKFMCPYLNKLIEFGLVKKEDVKQYVFPDIENDYFYVNFKEVSMFETEEGKKQQKEWEKEARKIKKVKEGKYLDVWEWPEYLRKKVMTFVGCNGNGLLSIFLRILTSFFLY